MSKELIERLRRGDVRDNEAADALEHLVGIIELAGKQEVAYYTRQQFGKEREICEKPFTTDWERLYTHPDYESARRIKELEAEVEYQRAQHKVTYDFLQEKLRKDACWQPIETAPRGANGISFMLVMWGPEGDENCGYAIQIDGRFFASAVYFCSGRKAKPFEIRETEVNPTHWMPLSNPPIDAAMGEK